MKKFYKFSITAISTVTAVGFTGWFYYKSNNGFKVYSNTNPFQQKRKHNLLSRDQQIINLRNGEEYDILVIGGGILGAGCALDAASRGLKTALVEMNDFSSGTSSKSTKLLHGGIRYLVAAILQQDYSQIEVVKQSLNERKTILEIAPHLTRPLQILIPAHKYWQIPSYWILFKIYDLLAYNNNLQKSYFVSKTKALELFPMLDKESLKGAIIYSEGQMDDARLNLAVAITAAKYGATVCNYVEVIKLHKRENVDGDLVLVGAKVYDHISKNQFNVKSKCIVNASGAFTDNSRQMDNDAVKPICAPSSGVHIVLPGYYCPSYMGLLDPYTSDKRVLFFLPWKNYTIVGTTDVSTKPTHSPEPNNSEIMFILSELKNYFNSDMQVRRGDILAAWKGLRPLIIDPEHQDSKNLLRNHFIEISKTKLVTVAGGKFTTYREIAEQTIDAAILACNLKPKIKQSVTKEIVLNGGTNWTPILYIQLLQDFGLDYDVAQHLAITYGTEALTVAQLASITGNITPVLGIKIHPQLPVIEAEVHYAIHEYACTLIDIISRRLGISFLNVEATRESLPRIADIMAADLKWSESEKQKELNDAYDFLDIEMGGNLNKLKEVSNIKTNLPHDKMCNYIERFNTIDKDKKGFISINDIRRTMKCFGDDKITEEKWHKILCQLNSTMNGQINLNEYLLLMSLIKTGETCYEENSNLINEISKLQTNIKIDRSGGGV